MVTFEYFRTKSPVKRYKTAICGSPSHVLETIRLKRCKKLEAVNQQAICENFSGKLYEIYKKITVKNLL